MESQAKVDRVPSGLENLVRLADRMTGGDDPRRQDPTPAQRAGSMWEFGEGGAGADAYHGMADTFDHGQNQMWETISGGLVSSACGSVEGQALCFNDEGNRVAVTTAVNTIGGGIVRFSLQMSYEDGLAADVALEYKAVGRAWHLLESYSEETYATPGFANPNADSLGSWDVSQTADGFVTYAVKLPEGAESPATKFRFRQIRDLVSGKAASWALDDVAVDAGGEAPAVQITAPKEKRHARMLTVVVQFSRAVFGFEAPDVHVTNATVVALNQFDSRISNAGALYTAHVRPEKPSEDWVGPFAIDVQVPAGVCVNADGRANEASNHIRLRHTMSRRRRRHAHADLSFGPRPGPADRRWGAVIAEEDKALTEATLRPLTEGEEHDADRARDPAGIFNDTEALDDRVQAAEELYERLTNGPARPPLALVEQLEDEIKTLKEARQRLATVEAMNMMNDPYAAKLRAAAKTRGDIDEFDYEDDLFDQKAHDELQHEIEESEKMHKELEEEVHRSEEIHKELESEMDVLRRERREMQDAMEEQKRLRQELAEERKKIHKEMEDLEEQHEKKYHGGQHAHHDHGGHGHHHEDEELGDDYEWEEYYEDDDEGHDHDHVAHDELDDGQGHSHVDGSMGEHEHHHDHGLLEGHSDSGFTEPGEEGEAHQHERAPHKKGRRKLRRKVRKDRGSAKKAHFHAHLDAGELAQVLHDLYGLEPKTHHHHSTAGGPGMSVDAATRAAAAREEKAELEEELAEQRRILYHKRRLKEEMDKEREEMAEERTRLEQERARLRKESAEERKAIADEKERLRREEAAERAERAAFNSQINAEREEREKFAEEQRHILEDFEKASAEAAAHESSTAHGHHSGDHAKATKEEVAELVKEMYGVEPEEELRRQREQQMKKMHQETEAMRHEKEELHEEMEEQRRLLYHKRRLRDELSEEKTEMKHERERLEAEKAAIAKEREREMKERVAFMAEQRKMLDELMMQQRAIREALSSTGLPPNMTPWTPGQPAPSADEGEGGGGGAAVGNLGKEHAAAAADSSAV